MEGLHRTQTYSRTLYPPACQNLSLSLSLSPFPTLPSPTLPSLPCPPVQIVKAGAMISNSVFSDNYADVAGGAVGFESNSPQGLSSDAGGGLYRDPPSGPAMWTNQVRAGMYLRGDIWIRVSIETRPSRRVGA